MEYIERNWLCKRMEKVRSSQQAILVFNWVTQFFPVSIVKWEDRRGKGGARIKSISLKLSILQAKLRDYPVSSKKNTRYPFLQNEKFCKVTKNIAMAPPRPSEDFWGIVKALELLKGLWNMN